MIFKRIEQEIEATAGDMLLIESESTCEEEYYFFSENDIQPSENGKDGVVFTELRSGISYVKNLLSTENVKAGSHIAGLGTVIEVIVQDKIQISF